MEIATTLKNVIERLATKKTEVNAKIKRDAREIKTLTKQVTEIESRIELLTLSLIHI